MKLLLIGAGKWGQKYISTISSIPNITLDIANRSNWKIKINEYPDGVLICTPPQSHVEIADYAMSRQIPVMVEKPLSLSSDEAAQLKIYDVPILVNHIHLFSEGYQNIKKYVAGKKIKSVYSFGTGLGPPRSDYSVLWDYAPHDLSLILDLLQDQPHTSKITQSNKYSDLYKIELLFDNCTAKSISGIGSDKCRLFTISLNEGFVSYDDLNRPNHHLPPLFNAIEVFIKSINKIPDDRLGLNLSLKIIKLIEYCNNML